MDSTSRVKVEYTDPSNVYPRFFKDLSPRLPLKDLHWSSGSRPTRSIADLFLEFISGEQTLPHLDPSSNEGSSGSQDNAISSAGEGAAKGRRHQIPGLRQTPYLKLYLLCCEDVDTYRANARKQLRDWVKGHTSTQSTTSLNKQDNHDAYEWLIIYINAVSVEGPENARPSSGIKANGNAEKRPTSSRWSSRGSTSVIEKLRSDFNSTSKNGIDRVTQIRLAETQDDGARQMEQQSDDGKDDLISKLKSRILASFDLRVSQYEDDIKEREGQKKVFGWNFNTFFVLKEGLAMGFESMGLLDDALTVYQELSIGLKNTIEEQQYEGAEQQTAHFVDFTADLYQAFKQVTTENLETVDESQPVSAHLVDPGTMLLNVDRKPFRELILSNQISTLDFQCYVFARQVSISLRLSNAIAYRSRPPSATIMPNHSVGDQKHLREGTPSLKPGDSRPENLLLLAEIVRSSIDFLTSMIMPLREDLQKATNGSPTNQQVHSKHSAMIHANSIENFISSWLFSASQVILEATAARYLTAQVDPLLRQFRPQASPDAESKGDHSATAEVEVHRNSLPIRTSSLPPQNPTQSSRSSTDHLATTNLHEVTKLTPPGNLHPGAQDLAAERGDLLCLQQRILSNIGSRYSDRRVEELTQLTSEIDQNEMHEISLGEDKSQQISSSPGSTAGQDILKLRGFCNATLLSTLRSRTEYHENHEVLTILALAHYVVGDRGKSAEALTADLAAARFHLEDYRVAATYFRQLAPFYANEGWSDLEISMLDKYAQCLSHLAKLEDYVRVGLKVLGKTIAIQRTVKKMLEVAYADPSSDLNISTCLSTLIAASKDLDAPVTVPLNDYFDSIDLGKLVQHRPQDDEFGLDFGLRSLLGETFQAQSLRICMIRINAGQRSELWLAAGEGQVIKPGKTRTTLTSKSMQPGWFCLNKVQIQASNVIFMVDFTPTTSNSLFPRNRESASYGQSDVYNQQPVLVWPKLGSLDATLIHYENVDLEKPNSLKMKINSGQNALLGGKVSVRPASAGLRLHTAEAIAHNDSIVLHDRSQPGSISFGKLPRDTSAGIRIPYTLENDLREIHVHFVIEYATTQGEFTYSNTANILVLLPLAINVQDIFKKDTLISKFTVGTSTTVPVHLSRCTLQENHDFHTFSPPFSDSGSDIFVAQPFSMVSKLHRITKSKDFTGPVDNRVFLMIEYRCLDKNVFATVEQHFSDALAASPYQQFSRVLRAFLAKTVCTKFTEKEIEMISVTHELHIDTFEGWGWDSLLIGFASVDRDELSKWLRAWHNENHIIRLESFEYISPMQHLTVPVEVPRMQVILTARLRPTLNSFSHSTDLKPVSLGQGVPMELLVDYSCGWDYTNFAVDEDTLLSFCFDVQANADLWLIGGQRKGHFKAREGKVLKFPLLLWPQKTGHLQFPSVEIQCLGDAVEGTARPAISCEVDYQSAGQSFHVVLDLSSTTVSLDSGGAGGGWLIESKGRAA